MFPEIPDVELRKFSFKYLKELANQLNVSTEEEADEDGTPGRKLNRVEINDAVAETIKKYQDTTGSCSEEDLKDLAIGVDLEYKDWVKGAGAKASVALRKEIIRVVNEKIDDAKAAMLKGKSSL